MNEVQLFEHPEFGQVPCHVIDGKPWFVGREAALRLEYANPNEAVRLHVSARHRRSEKIASPGAVPFQEQVLISEAGLYRLILRSNMPKAEEFTDWVTEELLPVVREAQKVGIDVVEELEKRIQEKDQRIDTLEKSNKLHLRNTETLYAQHANEDELKEQAFKLLHNGYVRVRSRSGHMKTIRDSYALRVHQTQIMREAVLQLV